MASAVSTHRQNLALPNRLSRNKHRGSVSSSTNNSRGESKEYFVIVSNLPLRTDRRSCMKHKDVLWKPFKDLVRKVINKGENGQDIRPQVADSGKVNILPDSLPTGDEPARCGYAICTLKSESHAKRALHWLGGNIWYGWPLSVMTCVQEGKELRTLEYRWQTVLQEPLNLNPLSTVSDRSLLRPPPARPIPPPFMGALRPDTRVRLPPQVVAENTLQTPSQSTIYTWAQNSYPAPPPTSGHNLALYSQPVPPYSIHSPTKPSNINIMIQVDDQTWQTYGSTMSSNTQVSMPVPYAMYSASTSSPMASSQSTHTYASYQSSPVHPPPPAILSPTAPSFTTILPTRPKPGDSSNNNNNNDFNSADQEVEGIGYPSSAPLPAPQGYHTNPNGTPINTAHGAVPICASTSVIVRNLPHRASQVAITAYIESGSGCAIRRYEAKDGSASSSAAAASGAVKGDKPPPSRKKLSVVLGFGSAEDAVKVRGWVDGREWDGRRLGCEVLKDDRVAVGGGLEAEGGMGWGAPLGGGAGSNNSSTCTSTSGSSTSGNSTIGSSSSSSSKDEQYEKDEAVGKKKRVVSDGPIIANGSEEDERSDVDCASRGR